MPMSEREPDVAKPVVRKGILRLLALTLFCASFAACFWDEIELWRGLSKAQELFHSHRDDQALQLLRKMLLTHGPQPKVALQLVRAHRRLGNLPSNRLNATANCRPTGSR